MQPSTDLICFPQKHSHQAFVCVTAITECLRRKKRADITTTQVPKTRLRHLLGHFHQLPAFPREVWFSLPLFSLPSHPNLVSILFSLCASVTFILLGLCSLSKQNQSLPELETVFCLGEILGPVVSERQLLLPFRIMLSTENTQGQSFSYNCLWSFSNLRFTFFSSLSKLVLNF